MDLSLCLCFGGLRTSCIATHLGCTRRGFGGVSDFVGFSSDLPKYPRKLRVIIPGLHEVLFDWRALFTMALLRLDAQVRSPWRSMASHALGRLQS